MALNLPIVVDFDGRGIRKAIAEFQKLETNAAKAQFAINKAALPAAAALTGLAVAAMGAAKAAAADQQAQVMLAGQIQRTTSATTAQIDANEQFISNLSKTAAVADDELRPALAALVTGTKDLQMAQRLLAVSLDVSAATGASLSQVSTALSRGFQGNNRALTRLSPELKTLIADGASFSEVLQVLEQNFGGAAKASADTAAGGMRKFQIAVGEAQEQIGTALLPLLEDLVPMLVAGAEWFQRNARAVGIAAVAFGSIAAVLITLNVAMAAYRTVAIATAAVNKLLAASNFAVQVSTGVGIATAIAGAAALGGIVIALNRAVTSNYNYAEATKKSTEETGLLKNMIDRARQAADARRATESRAAQASEKATSRANQMFASTRTALEQARQGLRDYAASLADTVRGYVSLTTAVQDAKTRETEYTDALAERAEAYAELNKLQNSNTKSADALADATARVARAETAVTTAQGRRTNFAAQFREQIDAAKRFSGQLQELIKQGLSRAGLAQLMNLGPVAGSEVAADLLAGTSGMTAASLSASLAEVDLAGQALGAGAISTDMNLLGQAAVARGGNNVYITVQGGDPQQVVDALRRYMKVNGAVPIKVTNK